VLYFTSVEDLGFDVRQVLGEALRVPMLRFKWKLKFKIVKISCIGCGMGQKS
jgi:hypothetical protein